jgi:Cu/Ag efflux protein CusF
MRKKISYVLALIITVVFLAGVSFAEEAKKEESKAKAPKEKVVVAKGEVTKVDAATITIKKAGKTPEEITLNVAPETVIKVGKEKKALADIKVGDKVKCSYVKDTMAAKSISK